MSNYSQSSLAAAVKAEASNWQAVGGLYGQTAKELSTLFTESGNAQVHLYMVTAQDLTGDPLVWNRAMSGLKKALSALPAPLVFTATRDFRPTHRAKNPLFEIATKASVDTAKQSAAREQEEKAAAIEKAAAEERAAEKAKKDEEEQAAYMQTTAQDIADDVLEHCGKLGISVETVMLALMGKSPNFVHGTAFEVAESAIDRLDTQAQAAVIANKVRHLSTNKVTELMGLDDSATVTVTIKAAPKAKAA